MTVRILVTGATGTVGRHLTSLDEALDGVDAAHLFALGAGDVTDPQAHVDDLVARVGRASVRRLTVLESTGTVPLGAAALAVGGSVIAPVEFMTDARWWADAIRGDGVAREGAPDAPSTVVERLTGRPARTFRAGAQENAATFR